VVICHEFDSSLLRSFRASICFTFWLVEEMLHVKLVVSILSHLRHVDGEGLEPLLVWGVLDHDEVGSAGLEVVELAAEDGWENSLLALKLQLVFAISVLIDCEDENESSDLHCQILGSSTANNSDGAVWLGDCALDVESVDTMLLHGFGEGPVHLLSVLGVWVRIRGGREIEDGTLNCEFGVDDEREDSFISVVAAHVTGNVVAEWKLGGNRPLVSLRVIFLTVSVGSSTNHEKLRSFILVLGSVKDSCWAHGVVLHRFNLNRLLELVVVIELQAEPLPEKGLVLDWECDVVEVVELDEPLEVDLREAEFVWVIFSFALADLQEPAGLAVLGILPPRTDLDVLSRTFEDEGHVRCLDLGDDERDLLVVEVLVQSLELDALKRSQEVSNRRKSTHRSAELLD